LKAWGHTVFAVQSQEDAVAHLCENEVDAIVLNLNLPGGSAMAIADFASYRHPKARIIAVTADRCFSDGSIFSHLSNASLLLPMGTLPDDLGRMVEYYAA
jgi:CheY-like chemotaxis protein